MRKTLSLLLGLSCLSGVALANSTLPPVTIKVYFKNPTEHPLVVYYDYLDYPNRTPHSMLIPAHSTLAVSSEKPSNNNDYALEVDAVKTTDGSGYARQYGEEDCEFDYEYGMSATGMITFTFPEIEGNLYKPVTCVISYT